MIFYPGLHQPADAKNFERCFLSVNRMRTRKSKLPVGDWIMDSGAFTEITRHGRYRHGVEEYADQIVKWSSSGNLVAAVAQDYMCEPFALAATGMTVEEHQRLTVERYDALVAAVRARGCSTYVMPVLQGYAPAEYARHLEMYGDRFAPGAYVGVGSVCKRNSKPSQIADVLLTILERRPDLRLHGFGLKFTALQSPMIRSALYSADSLAWSFAARYEGRNPNDWREAMAYTRRIEELGS